MRFLTEAKAVGGTIRFKSLLMPLGGNSVRRIWGRKFWLWFFFFSVCGAGFFFQKRAVPLTKSCQNDAKPPRSQEMKKKSLENVAGSRPLLVPLRDIFSEILNVISGWQILKYSVFLRGIPGSWKIWCWRRFLLYRLRGFSFVSSAYWYGIFLVFFFLFRTTVFNIAPLN